MPYVLKPNKLFAKDPNGDGYLPQNVITDQATADMVDEIEEAGAGQITAIEEKGEEVLESIPQDYTELSDEVDDIQSALENNYALNNGNYPEMTVGNAEQLVTTVGVADNLPYNFRTAGGTADIGDRLMEKVVGGTVCWNQLQKNTKSNSANGVTFTYNNGKLTIATASGGATASTWWLSPSNSKWLWLKNHIYLITLGNSNYAPAAGANPHWYIAAASSNINLNKNNSIISYTADTAEYYLQFVTYTGNEVNESFIPQVFDLTQMFGSTIADYVYGLETATAGAGVAWFKHLFPKDYYEYNAGELMSVQAASHKMVGKNQCVKVIRGFPDTSISQIRIDNDSESLVFYAKSGCTYTASHGDIANNRNQLCHVGTDNVVHGTPYTELIALNSNGLSWTATWDGWTVWYRKASADAALEAVAQVEIGTAATAYEPYQKHTYPLDNDLTLRGIPKLDSNNNLYYDGDVYESDGTVTRRYGVVDLGTLSWTRMQLPAPISDEIYAFRVQNFAIKASGLCVCSKYPYVRPYTNLANNINGDKNCAYIYSTNFCIRDDAYTDDATFKTAMSGVYLVYELATPTTETSEPYTNPQWVNDFGTEEYTDAGVIAGTRDVAIPVGHDTFYPENLRAKIEELPKDFSTLIAPVEKTFKATQAYASGALFIVNNVLYKATASIANGATITPGTNCQATTLAAVIAALA